jgi:hypothetical protein
MAQVTEILSQKGGVLSSNPSTAKIILKKSCQYSSYKSGFLHL